MASISRGTSGSGTDRPIIVIMLAAGFASTIGGLPFNSLPILLGALADDFSFSPQHTGLLGSTCFAGYLAGTLVAALFMDRFDWRKLTFLCGIGSAGALLVSAHVDASLQYPLWALVGFFASSMTCLGLRIMGDLPNKERALGVRQGIELGVTSAVLFALPPLVISRFHYPGAAVSLAVMILLLVTSAGWLPARSDRRDPEQAGTTPTGRRVLPYLALVIFLAYASGQIGLWAFLERMGNAIKLAPAELGIVFAVLKLLGGASAFAAALVGDRLGFRVPHWLAAGILVGGLLLLSGARGFPAFALGAWIWEVGLTCGCIYQTAAIARLDPSGRAIMLVPAAFALSSMIGPGVAGFLVADGFLPLVLLALSTSLVPSLAYGVFLYRRLGAAPAAGHAH